ncbi:MAG TPA: DNA polymerase III subunit gamma/tau [Solirubrobacteraceae bacterium]|nr:DNA polymerase III subunit gamma/tau [Solirubrobacteraceae bacterium]
MVAGGAQSLYRKHRPRTFADVVGQDAVVRTLRHAVERGKVHHAYLFVGSRGTGKTSMAKILASCLNCERGGPTVEPCGQCDSCRSIASATSLDVIEMDAASNNSVDDIRELRESVAFAPVSGRHKVYILDEAHMLTQAAWNAFLKTLEEPPPNTVFVLATTEAGKVPATVVDRCHRFDFHRPTVEQIASVAMRAAEAESIEIPPEALAAIARSATGSFRDALGTLEQIVTYSGTSVSLEDVLAVLGVADEQLLASALDAVASGDARAALLAVARCAEGGRDASSFTRDLEGRARELLVVQTLGGVPPELSLTPEIDERLREQAARIGPAEVVRLLDLLGAALEAVRAGADPRTQLELALVKAAAPAADGSTRALLARIERLEQALAGSAPSSAPPPPGASASVAPGSSPVSPAPASPASPASPSRTAAPSAPSAPSSPLVPSPSSSPAQSDAAPEQPMSQPAAETSEQESVAAPTAVLALSGPSDLDALWAAVHESVRAEHGLLGAVLNEATPATLTEEELLLAFPPTAAFHKRKAEDPANRSTLIETLRRLTGRHYRLAFELRDDLDANAGAGGAPPSEEEIMARLVSELDAEELPEDWLQQKGGE